MDVTPFSSSAGKARAGAGAATAATGGGSGNVPAKKKERWWKRKHQKAGGGGGVGEIDAGGAGAGGDSSSRHAHGSDAGSDDDVDEAEEAAARADSKGHPAAAAVAGVCPPGLQQPPLRRQWAHLPALILAPSRELAIQVRERRGWGRMGGCVCARGREGTTLPHHPPLTQVRDHINALCVGTAVRAIAIVGGLTPIKQARA
jgi:hypothetical protein